MSTLNREAQPNRQAQRNRLENGDRQCLREHFKALEPVPQLRVLVLTTNTTGQPRC